MVWQLTATPFLSTLTFLIKLCLAFWTSNADTPFALWNTNLLLAGRTLVNMMCLALLHIRLFLLKKCKKTTFYTKKFHVLIVTLVYIFRKYTEIRIE